MHLKHRFRINPFSDDNRIGINSVHKIWLLIPCIFFLLSAQVSFANSHTDKPGANFSRSISENFFLASNETISPDQAAEIAKQGKDSKVLKVTKSAEGNKNLYRVKILTTKGHVKHVLIDATSGEIIQGNKK